MKFAFKSEQKPQPFSISGKTAKNEIAVFYLMRLDDFLVVDVEGFC